MVVLQTTSCIRVTNSSNAAVQTVLLNDIDTIEDSQGQRKMKCMLAQHSINPPTPAPLSCLAPSHDRASPRLLLRLLPRIPRGQI